MKLNPCTAIVDVDGTVCGGKAETSFYRGSKDDAWWIVGCSSCSWVIEGAKPFHDSDEAVALWNLNNPLPEVGAEEPPPTKAELEMYHDAGESEPDWPNQ